MIFRPHFKTEVFQAPKSGVGKNLFCKEPDSKQFRPYKQIVAHFCHNSSVLHESSHRQYANEWAYCMPTKLYLQTQALGQIGPVAGCNFLTPGLNEAGEEQLPPNKEPLSEGKRLRIGSYCTLLLIDNTFKIQNKISSAS